MSTEPSGRIECRYALVAEGESLDFVETFEVGHLTKDAWEGSRGEALRNVARLLWLAAGVSYYKLAAPEVVEVPTGLSSVEEEWLEALYREGLGEFAFENGIDLSTRPTFAAERRSQPGAVRGLGLPRRSLVPVGGGKDSCVTLDVLQSIGEDMVPFNVNGHRAARETAAAAGLDLLVAHRCLDPRLQELNASGAMNGHVPVTAIVSLVAAAAAITAGADRVVFSNERSANVPSFYANGLPVNHQYSKGLAAERLLRGALGEVVPELEYLSLLRPLSELSIARMFARGERFHPVFTSCNAAFRIDASRRVERWCCDCPKCRFVFLVLAPFMPRPDLVAAFGKDLLDDGSQLDGFRELLGLQGHKPFECVGEVEESRAALLLAGSVPGWAESCNVAPLLGELANAGLTPTGYEVERLLAAADEHELTPDLERAVLDALETST